MIEKNPTVIVCGLGRVGRRVLGYLRAAQMPVVVIDNNRSPDDPELAGVPLIKADFRQRAVLEQAGIATARGVLVLTSDDLANISTALLVRHMRPDVRIVVRMFNQNLLARLGKAVTNVYALSVSALTAPLLALTALTGEALGTFGEGEHLREVAELNVSDSPQGLRGKSITDAAQRYRFQAIAHLPDQGTEKFLGEVDPEAKLAPGDRLILCGTPNDLAPLLLREGDDSREHGLWFGRTRRFGRIFWRAFGDVEMAVKACIIVLAIVVLGSMMVYHIGIGLKWADSLYRTVAVIATAGAHLHEEELKEPWHKVFVSLLRIFGAAVTAAFTAIVTNYLIRTRLGQALEIRRIPDGGHIVVCGLGNIGFRVVEELVRREETVVAIERATDNHFVATARRLGVGVINGDATIPEVLRQAHAGTARALLAVTNNELANLEVALLTRELNPKQRVVVRLADAHLAQTLREAANIRLALSTSAMAAPAFFAALFGDRVRNIFLIEGRVLAVVELIVQAEDPYLAGQAVRALAVDYRLLPVALVGPDGMSRPQPMNHRLSAGDQMTALLLLPDLVRLLRRERVPADWAVDVTSFPPVARGWLTSLLHSERQLDAAAAEKALEELPLCLGSCLTRGQAEDLLALCRRERVGGTLRQEDSSLT
jgi:Trk K+ transport system NAD-binding subunit